VMTVLQMLYTYLPGMNRLFGSAPLDLSAWAWVVGVAVVIHVIVEIEKAIRRRWERKQPPVEVC